MVSFLPLPLVPYSIVFIFIYLSCLLCSPRLLHLLPPFSPSLSPTSLIPDSRTFCHYFQSSDVEIVGIPEELDITSLRGRGLQPDEEELPEGDAPPTDPEPVAVEIDEGIVMQLVSMGFDVEGCKKAVFHTKNRGNQGNLEASCN